MKKEELFNILKKVVLGEDQKEKFFDVKTTDGKVLRIDGDVLEKGADAYLILEDGTVGAVNDGDYILESGETVMISGGRVADFIPVDVPAEEPAVEDAPVAEDAPVEEAPAEEPAAVVEEIVVAETPEEVSDEMDWNEAVKALAEEIAKINEKIDAMVMSAEEMRSHISQFSKIPTEDGLKKEKTGFKSEAEKNKDLRLSNLEKIKALRIKK